MFYKGKAFCRQYLRQRAVVAKMYITATIRRVLWQTTTCFVSLFCQNEFCVAIVWVFVSSFLLHVYLRCSHSAWCFVRFPATSSTPFPLFMSIIIGVLTHYFFIFIFIWLLTRILQLINVFIMTVICRCCNIPSFNFIITVLLKVSCFLLPSRDRINLLAAPTEAVCGVCLPRYSGDRVGPGDLSCRTRLTLPPPHLTSPHPLPLLAKLR